MSKRKKSEAKRGATRARAKSTGAGPRAASPPKKRGKHGPLLNYAAALSAVSKGATNRNVARAAGSRASEKQLAKAGAEIVKRLRDRGLIQETFNRLGFTIEHFARGVIEGTQALKVTRIKVKEKIQEFTDIDTMARQAARDQYARALGIYNMPLEAGGGGDGLASIPDELLVAIASGEIDTDRLSKLGVAGT